MTDTGAAYTLFVVGLLNILTAVFWAWYTKRRYDEDQLNLLTFGLMLFMMLLNAICGSIILEEALKRLT